MDHSPLPTQTAPTAPPVPSVPPADGPAEEADVAELTAWAHARMGLTATPVPEQPNGARLTREVRRWLLERGLLAEGTALLAQVDRIGAAHLVCMCMPDAPLAVQRVTSMYTTWLFVFDDEVAEGGELDRYAAAVERLVRTGEVPAGADATLRTLADVRELVVELGGAGLLPRFADGMAAYLDACRREEPWRRAGRVPTLDRYLRDRARTAGFHHILHLGRLAPGLVGPDQPFPAELERLAELACLIGGIDNDVLGYHREASTGDPINLVNVVREHEGLSLAGAFRRAVELHAEHRARFDRLLARVVDDPGQPGPVRRQAAAIAGWVDGPRSWTGRTARYGWEPGWPVGEERAVRV